MERLKVAKEILKVAADLMFADNDYIYDPDHKKHPGGGYHKTEKGWSKLDEKNDESNGRKKETVVNPYPASNAFDTARVTTNPKQLEKLSKHEHFRIRENVANNPNTPEKVLRNLGSDEAFQVRAQIAGNPKTPEDVLEKLSNEKESYILGNLSRNPSATPKILKNVAINTKESYILDDLSKHSDMQVRMEVAHNPNTSTETLAKLAGDKERQVRWDVAENHNTSTKTLDKIVSETNDSDILEGVAGNPNTSTETLKKLSNHEHHYVSKAAKENLTKRENSQNEVKFDITKLSPELREKVKDWDAEDIAKFIGWLKENKG